MPRFDDRSRRTILDFAGAMGVLARENADGSFAFRFERSGDLSLLASGDGRPGNEGPIMVSLSRPQPRPYPALAAALLARAGLEPATNFGVHAGLARDESLVLTLAIPRERFDLPTLESGFDRLVALFDAAEAEAA